MGVPKASASAVAMESLGSDTDKTYDLYEDDAAHPPSRWSRWVQTLMTFITPNPVKDTSSSVSQRFDVVRPRNEI